jgi:mono/diheme cytochrome c family protein
MRIEDKLLKTIMRLAIPFAVVTVCSCTSKKNSEVPGSPQANQSLLVERGQKIYLANCIACHNALPNNDGSLGPAIAGSSLELIQARVVNGSYPPGYQPKRTSHVMPAFPQLKGDIPALHPALHAFLNQK